MIENIDRFFGDLQAVVKDVALSLPHFLDFGLCPTMERPKARQKKQQFFWDQKKAAQNGRLLGVGIFLAFFGWEKNLKCWGSQQQIDVYNTGTLKASMKWHARPWRG